MTTKADDIWEGLLAGNKRFAVGRARHPAQQASDRERLIGGQTPHVAILACADSRVPPEIVFDTGLGALFDIRNAGQVLDTASLGSLEFAVAALHVGLIVVLAHSSCGGVAAARAWDRGESAPPGAHLPHMVAGILPSVAASRRQGDGSADDIGRRHLLTTVDAVTTASPLLGDAVHTETVGVIGARYDLGTGLVEALTTIDGRPLPGALKATHPVSREEIH